MWKSYIETRPLVVSPCSFVYVLSLYPLVWFGFLVLRCSHTVYYTQTKTASTIGYKLTIENVKYSKPERNIKRYSETTNCTSALGYNLDSVIVMQSWLCMKPSWNARHLDVTAEGTSVPIETRTEVCLGVQLLLPINRQQENKNTTLAYNIKLSRLILPRLAVRIP